MDILRDYGVGEYNDKNDKLNQFCEETEWSIPISNYLSDDYAHRYHLLIIWKDQLVIRNQIEYILMNKRFKNCVKRVTNYSDSDIGSNHNC